jgi:hypothetical protein
MPSQGDDLALPLFSEMNRHNYNRWEMFETQIQFFISRLLVGSQSFQKCEMARCADVRVMTPEASRDRINTFNEIQAILPTTMGNSLLIPVFHLSVAGFFRTETTATLSPSDEYPLGAIPGAPNSVIASKWRSKT